METPSPNRVGEKGETDIMTVSLLLEAAGIDSLDDESLATENRRFFNIFFRIPFPSLKLNCSLRFQHSR